MKHLSLEDEVSSEKSKGLDGYLPYDAQVEVDTLGSADTFGRRFG